MSEIDKTLFRILKDLECKEFIFNPEMHPSLAAAIVSASLPYKPGVYLVFDYREDKLGKLLYVGKAGTDKVGNINTHQLPKRLLAVCYPPEKYSNSILPPPKHYSRNEAWPNMMKQDGIAAIKVFCFFSKINDEFKVELDSIPFLLESKINSLLETKPLWAK